MTDWTWDTTFNNVMFSIVCVGFGIALVESHSSWRGQCATLVSYIGLLVMQFQRKWRTGVMLTSVLLVAHIVLLLVTFPPPTHPPHAADGGRNCGNTVAIAR